MTDYPFDVIIVLGATQNPDGTAGPAMARRVRHGVKCHRDDKAPHLLMTGGCTTSDVPECTTMADLAISEGLDVDVIFQEDRSTRTLGNAIECRKIMTDRGWQRALLVTDRFHMPRALYTFRAFGIDVTPEPNPVPLSFTTMVSVMRESFARLVYPGTIRRFLAAE